MAKSRYTEEEIRQIAEMSKDPANLQPAGPEDWDMCRRMADTIAEGFTDEDWTIVLNRVDPDRAAQHLSRRPPEDRPRLLGLIHPDRRPAVEARLTVTA